MSEIEYQITAKKEHAHGAYLWVARCSKYPNLEVYGDTSEEAEHLLLDSIVTALDFPERAGEEFVQAQCNKSDWTPIDYTQSDTGEGCFDGKPVLLLVDSFLLENQIIQGTFEIVNGQHVWNTAANYISAEDATHYRPIPDGWR